MIEDEDRHASGCRGEVQHALELDLAWRARRAYLRERYLHRLEGGLGGRWAPAAAAKTSAAMERSARHRAYLTAS
jgi:hypothetical protein